jgi:hypothetical protein
MIDAIALIAGLLCITVIFLVTAYLMSRTK